MEIAEYVRYPRMRKAVPNCDGKTDLFDATIDGGDWHADDVVKAKAVCHDGDGCPFLHSCLEWALANGVHGVWGGLDGDERKAILKTRREKARPYVTPRVHRSGTVTGAR